MTERCLIDTNIMIRHLVGDHPAHTNAVAGLFASADAGHRILVLLPSVLGECVFVLESFYKYPRRRVAESLSMVIEAPGVEIADLNIHADALNRYAAGKLHFVDCLLAAHAAASGIPVASFDADFARFQDVQMLNPLNHR